MAQFSMEIMRLIGSVPRGNQQTKHIDDAVASLSVVLSDEEAERLEKAYTARLDQQGVSIPALLHRSIEASTGFKRDAPLV
ncbi:hypothetical protein Rhsp01_26210 [Rhizobium sp. NBRC 114257]|uniref:Uncharacterized protein n=1 Tax=Rhizobium dioscoreae TaxID=2653122 RepID=A0ABQ0Z5H2_9HYPH|nr:MULTISPECIES: hypothetical protein [Rhizobium]GES50793.1 hypothetical protein RsS93_34070 [Rhizobium dioscoreae]GLU81445.1 hypothetical protein Rhsp01_26210 [Rhizobium sp. NBRC 114257]